MDKLKIHAGICDGIEDLYRRKNADYGDSFAKARREVPCYTLGDKEPCDGFDDAPAAPAPAPEEKPAKADSAAPAGGSKPKFDLDSLLGS